MIDNVNGTYTLVARPAEDYTPPPVEQPSDPPTEEELEVVEEEVAVQEEIKTEEKISWTGETYKEGPWMQQVAFTIGDREVTVQEVFVGVSTLTVIIIVAVAVVCLILTYWQRDNIAEGARRASTVVRRTISGKQDEGPAGPDRPVKEIVKEQDLKKNQKNFMEDKLNNDRADDAASNHGDGDIELQNQN